MKLPWKSGVECEDPPMGPRVMSLFSAHGSSCHGEGFYRKIYPAGDSRNLRAGWKPESAKTSSPPKQSGQLTKTHLLLCQPIWRWSIHWRYSSQFPDPNPHKIVPEKQRKNLWPISALPNDATSKNWSLSQRFPPSNTRVAKLLGEWHHNVFDHCRLREVHVPWHRAVPGKFIRGLVLRRWECHGIVGNLPQIWNFTRKKTPSLLEISDPKIWIFDRNM